MSTVHYTPLLSAGCCWYTQQCFAVVNVYFSLCVIILMLMCKRMLFEWNETNNENHLTHKIAIFLRPLPDPRNWWKFVCRTNTRVRGREKEFQIHIFSLSLLFIFLLELFSNFFFLYKLEDEFEYKLQKLFQNLFHVIYFTMNHQIRNESKIYFVKLIVLFSKTLGVREHDDFRALYRNKKDNLHWLY